MANQNQQQPQPADPPAMVGWPGMAPMALLPPYGYYQHGCRACGNDGADDPAYNQLHRVCSEHRDGANCGGRLHLFCYQCGIFEDFTRFRRGQKTCIYKLNLIRQRRLRRRQQGG